MLVNKLHLSEFASNSLLNFKLKNLIKFLYITDKNLEKRLYELEQRNIIRQIGSTPSDKSVFGTTFLNPLILVTKGDSIEVVPDTRRLNSNTDQVFESKLKLLLTKESELPKYQVCQ